MANWKQPIRKNGERLSGVLAGLFINRIFVTVFSLIFIVVGTLFAVQLGKGYRPSRDGLLQPTGLLSANSFPTGAQVFIDGRLVTATNNTMNLQPGEYDVEIRKEGFTSWAKRLNIQKELVTQTNALLFPSAPSLSPLSFSGAQNIVPSPDGQRIVFYTSSASAELRNGLYVLDLTTSILPNQRGPRQIMTPTSMFDLETAIMIWSPDSSQILISQENRNILLDPNRLNTPESMSDVSHRLMFLFDEWEAEMYSKERVRLATFPPEIQRIASESARNVYVSPDGKKVVFTSIKTDVIPEELIQPTPSSSTQPEERQLVEGGVYVYDSIEDKVFRVGSNTAIIQASNRITLADDLYISRAKTLEASPSAFRRLQGETMNETARNYLLHHTNAIAGGLQWLPDSQYLIGLRDGRVIAVEYDGTNETILYSGPLTDRFVYPWPNGSRLVILTNFNTDGDIPNLYSMSLR